MRESRIALRSIRATNDKDMRGTTMHRRQILRAFAGAALCPLCAPAAFAAETHWSYEGPTGPDKWGDLAPVYRTCSAGSQQSPIDIGQTIAAQLPPLKIAWGKGADLIVNNGHTIQLSFTDGGGNTLTVGDRSFKLAQFHFHRPSEHLVGGRNFPMEAHFVHEDPAWGIAVVGVLMASGTANPTFNRVVASMPPTPGPPVKVDPPIDPNGLLPAGRGYFRYAGSLTTPPCSETIDWLLLADPIQVADTDVARFAQLYPRNARPAQHGNWRFVLRSG